MALKRPPGPAVQACGPPDPKAPARWHRLWVVPRSGEHRAYALGQSVTWVWRHYCSLRRAFVHCTDYTGTCLLCRNGHGREQSGYLPVLIGEEQRTMVVTAGAWRYSRSLQTANGALRGYLLTAFRLHPRANGPLRVWLTGDHIDGRRLPAAWDVIEELTERYSRERQGRTEAEREGRKHG